MNKQRVREVLEKHLKQETKKAQNICTRPKAHPQSRSHHIEGSCSASDAKGTILSVAPLTSLTGTGIVTSASAELVRGSPSRSSRAHRRATSFAAIIWHAREAAERV
jgi:hypothetical protein